VSVVGIALLVAAVALICALEWPRLSGGRRIARPKAARRRRRRSHLRVVPDDDDETDEFARSVERDLANLPTIDERDRRR
jgi:hypothetical protein